MRVPKLCFLAFVAVLSLTLNSCDKSVIKEENQTVDGNQWSYDNPKLFAVTITDTTQHCNIYINIRHSFQFEWRNMWVNIETTFPDSTVYSKRVNLPMSEPDGVWYGKCLGDNCDLQVPIQQNAVFPQMGTYTFKIKQDMRANPIGYVKSVGMRIEKVQQ
ncbi:MAG: gliding motility lipoprotein GldH [Chitinophagales bacterium]|nr:gliding motility lipoprotein GldH [Chitinophagales bacterium]